MSLFVGRLSKKRLLHGFAAFTISTTEKSDLGSISSCNSIGSETFFTLWMANLIVV